MDSTTQTNIGRPELKVVRDVPISVENAFISSVPGRLAHAKINNFVLSNSPAEKARQSAVIASLIDICKNIDEFVRNSHQLFLWGRVGTGKDHLAVAVGRQAMLNGFAVRWCDAATLYETVLDYNKRDREMHRLRGYEVVILSDAVCNRDWNERRQYALRKIVNDRWNNGLPTWITANVTDVYGNGPNTAETLFVKDTLDRLLDGAAVLHCDWGSYRATRKWSGTGNRT